MSPIIQSSNQQRPSFTFSSRGEIPISKDRSPQGIGKSPYSLGTTIRYLFNLIFNGFFSYAKPSDMNRLSNKEVTHLSNKPLSNSSTLKIVFLGDVMTSLSGAFPTVETKIIEILKEADIVVANVESPVVEFSGEVQKRGSLSFKMDNTYLKALYDLAPTSKWVFSLANNHACDQDIEGIQQTIQAIKSVMPEARIIGAQEQKDADSVLSIQVNKGPKIGVVAWTDVMNDDKKHHKAPVVRGQDLSIGLVRTLREKYDYLIGFPHGHVEQSYMPEKTTRKKWINLMEPNGFDLVVGHGPHVLQPAERVGEKGLLHHSIGNFCSPKGPSQTKIGAIFQANLYFSERKSTVHRIEHTIHLLEQGENTVSLYNSSKTSFSKIIKRLKKHWPEMAALKISRKKPFFASRSFQLLRSAANRTFPLFRKSLSHLTRALTSSF